MAKENPKQQSPEEEVALLRSQMRLLASLAGRPRKEPPPQEESQEENWKQSES